jgi:hypothetical protein
MQPGLDVLALSVNARGQPTDTAKAIDSNAARRDLIKVEGHAYSRRISVDQNG